jgi:hypothetical protein
MKALLNGSYGSRYCPYGFIDDRSGAAGTDFRVCFL